MKTLFLALAALTLTACASTPLAVLSDFSDDRAEVMVPYTSLFGLGQSPDAAAARELADPVAEEHCTLVGKTTTYVSLRPLANSPDGGDYVILYRCEGATRVIVE